jgi:shikimate dehydrogenase
MKTFGLIGYRLDYSFSKGYFTEKFKNLNLNDHEYVKFELDTSKDFPGIFESGKEIGGLNCTIPYKQELMQFLDEIDEGAAAVGAVNTIKVIRQENKTILKGYNTDVIGFRKALEPLLTAEHKKALILGTGGASKAIKFVLEKLGISYISASIEDELNENEIRYEDITGDVIKEYTVLINATPLGTHPKVNDCPSLPYCSLTENHILFDLVYNPEVTKFMKKGLKKGAKVKNGLEMLHGQAEGAWDIWNS